MSRFAFPPDDANNVTCTMIRFRSVLTLLILALFASLPATGIAQSEQGVGTQAFYTDSGYAEFISSAPWLEFKGVSSSLTGLIDVERNILDFYIDLATLDTGIRLRNKHMRDSYLETDQFPYAEFMGSLVQVPSLPEGDTVDVVAKGTFTIHGVAREIEVEGTLARRGDELRFSAAWSVALSAHDIQRPAIVAYQLSDVVTVRVEGVLTPYTPDANASDR